jgi:geranylgeranyl diphosphate synthase type II
MDFNVYLKKKQGLVDGFLKKCLTTKKTNHCFPEKHLYKAMRYSLMAGGKRLRPLLVIASYEAAGGKLRNILPVAASLELIHTYSLIHDDLPAMDNDDFRRNKPTNHRVFGEAIAILAGDALLTDAFGIIARASLPPEILINVFRELTYACGPQGMVGGQTADIIFEDKKINENELRYIHTHKTGAFIRASVRIGAIMSEASPAILHSLTKYGEKIGLAYQIVDDILDVIGTKKELGKSTGIDAMRGKNTYPSVFGLDESKRKAKNLIDGSLKALKGFDRKADPLREIAKYILRRRN